MTSSGFENEREILYKVLFDMRKDVTELKRIVHSLMAERTNSSAATPSDGYINPSPKIVKGASVLPTIITTSNMEHKPSRKKHNADIEDTEEYIEESLSLEEVEKDMIRKALIKHKGKRKDAAQDLNISERTLYRKIKKYGLA